MEFPVTVEEFMEQYKIVDSDHVYTNGSELVPIFRMRQWFEHLDSAIKTNAHRIRAMTDEELAEWASIREMCFIYHLLINDPDLRNKCRIYDNCKDCWLDWLKQESECET